MSSLLIILLILLIIPTSFFINSEYFIIYIISLLLYLILVSTFKHIKTNNIIKQYHDCGYLYTEEKFTTGIIIKIIEINLCIIIVIFILGLLLSSYLKLDYLWLIFISFGSSIWVAPTLNILNSYLNLYEPKPKLSILFYLINVTYFICMIFLIFNILKINEFTKILILSLGPLFSGILIILYTISIIVSKNINNQKKSKEESIYNYKKDINQILSSNIYISLIDIVKYSYLYISIILVYKSYLKYNSILIKSNIITNTYFYMIIFTGFFLIPLINTLKKHLKKLNDLSENDLKKNIQEIYYKYIVKLFPLVIIICFASYPISILVFNDNRITLGLLVILMFVYSIYYITLKLIISFKNPKKVNKFLIVGLISNIIIIVPMIESFYRMGYSLVYGSIFSIIISLLVSIFIGVYYINKKYKLNLNKGFEKTLDIVYKSIILITILLITQYLIMKILNGIIGNVILIIFYITIIYVYIKINNYFKKS